MEFFCFLTLPFFLSLWSQLSGQLRSTALFWMALDLSTALPQEEGQCHCKIFVRSSQELCCGWCCQGRQPGAGPHVFQGEIVAQSWSRSEHSLRCLACCQELCLSDYRHDVAFSACLNMEWHVLKSESICFICDLMPACLLVWFNAKAHLCGTGSGLDELCLTMIWPDLHTIFLLSRTQNARLKMTALMFSYTINQWKNWCLFF